MFKIFWGAIQIFPALMGTTLCLSASATTVPETLTSTQTIPDAKSATPQTSSINQNQPTPASVLANTPQEPANSTIIPTAATSAKQNVDNNPMDQVTNVSQLRDVSPEDWAYEALRSLVERYGCIAGYPDGTFRGNLATKPF